MTKTLKITFIALGILVLSLGIAAWLLSRVDVKGRFESAASQTTGLTVRVHGKVSVRLFPTLHVSLTRVTARKGDQEIASIGTADVTAEYPPLLHGEAVLSSVRLREVNIELERDRTGQLNVKRSASGDRTVGTVRIEHVSFEKTNFRYTNRQVDKFFVATNCTVDDDDFQLAGGSSTGFMRNLSLSARVACKEMRNNRFTGNDVRLKVAGKEGKLKFAPIDLRMMSGKGSAVIDGDYTGDVPSYQVHYEISQLQVGELFKSVAPTKAGTGRLDFKSDLSMRGFNAVELTRTAKGEASLRGQDLELAIGNLDEKLRRYKSTQSFDLIDLGAFFIAGPIGPAVTKGYEFGAVLQSSEGTTHINTFVSLWQVDHGIAHAADVEMTTNENTLAMKGALDFPKKEFEAVTIAVLDKEGCVRVEQKVNGAFGKPEIRKPDVLKSVAGPIRHLIEKVKDMAGSKCEVFLARIDHIPE